MEQIRLSGPYFEDFERGLEFEGPAVTLTTGHAAAYQAAFGDRLRLPLDHALSRAVTGGERPLAHPLLAIALAIGQSTWASQHVRANLFYRGLLLHRPVFLGDTLRTRTRVVALRQNQPRPGRPTTGIVALEIRTLNDAGETVLHFHRCPMIPCRDPAAQTGHEDDIDLVGTQLTTADVSRAAPEWSLPGPMVPTTLPGLPATPPAGARLVIESRDTVTGATEFARLTLNLARTHTDAGASHLGQRLVFGGHTIGMAFAQLTRALPDLLTVLAWDMCDHAAPVLEGDRLRTEVSVLENVNLGGGRLLKLHAECYATRVEGEPELMVLDWSFWALSL